MEELKQNEWKIREGSIRKNTKALSQRNPCTINHQQQRQYRNE